MNFRKTLFKISLAAVIAVTATSCRADKVEDCLYYEPAGVTQVTGPTTAQVDEPVELEVSFQVYSGCGGLGSFNQQVLPYERTIEVIAKYAGCICTANAPVVKGTYTFITGTPGIYTLKFDKGNNSYVVHTIQVQ